jgi:hypothetical protein
LMFCRNSPIVMTYLVPEFSSCLAISSGENEQYL